MKNKLSIIVVTVFMIGLVACSKNSPSVATPDNNPNITINGSSTTDLTGASKYFYVSALYEDSIVIINSSATNTTGLNSLSSIKSLPSSVNYLMLQITAPTTISQNTTYTYGVSNSVNVVSTFQLNGTTYSSLDALPCSVTIDTLNTTFISGNYSTTVEKTNSIGDYSKSTFTGKFKAYF